jgi:ubiquinone/menaquinone biosynthesis C-methylase UbiE
MEDQDRPLKIAEIGIGTGPNLEFYPAGSKVYGVDPNPHFDYYLRKNQRHCQRRGKAIDVEFVKEFGENMTSIGNNTMDAVVLCYVLCSVKDVVNVLIEAKRVLKKVSVLVGARPALCYSHRA